MKEIMMMLARAALPGRVSEIHRLQEIQKDSAMGPAEGEGEANTRQFPRED